MNLGFLKLKTNNCCLKIGMNGWMDGWMDGLMSRWIDR
jgi:hypothetical protein